MSITKDVAKGVFWIALAKYSGIVVSLIITAILARLISPEAFGTIAIAMVVLYFLNMFADIGIGPAVVQFKGLTKHHLDSLFTLNVYIGIVLASMLYWGAELIATYYDDAALEHVCQMMAVVVFFNAMNVVPNALMRKDRRFRTIAMRTLFFQVTSGCVAVWGAWHNWGVYALLVSPILTAIGVFVVNYYNYPLHFVFVMSKEALKRVASFSFFQFAFSFCNYFSRNLDKLIVGKFFSMEQLGYYDKSYHLMLYPLHNITFVIEPVLHPILSSLQNNKHELQLKNQKLATVISYISFPIGLILFFCSTEIIRIIYGNQWDKAIPVFQILALSLPLQMIQSTSGAIYQAAGKTNHMFYNGISNTIVTVSGFMIAAIWGGSIEAMAWAWVLTLVVNFVNSYFILYHFTLQEPTIPFYKSFVPQIINSGVVFAIMWLIVAFLPKMSSLPALLCKTIIVCVLSILMAFLLKQYNIRMIAEVVKNRITQKKNSL